jgi:hypothetical protein
MFRPGNIGFIENVACMDCRSATGPTDGVVIGTISEDRLESLDYTLTLVLPSSSGIKNPPKVEALKVTALWKAMGPQGEGEELR